MTSEFLMIAFSLGVFLRSLSYIRSLKEIKHVALSIFWSLVVSLLVIVEFKISYNLGYYSLISIISYVIFYSIVQVKNILPLISEQSLLQLSLISLYIFNINYYDNDLTGNILLFILLCFSSVMIFFGFINYKFPNPLKIFFYTYFLLINTFLGIFYFSFQIISIFIMSEANSNIGIYEAFFGGLAFMYLVSNCFYLYLLMPIPGKRQTLAERLKEWRQFTSVMIEKHTDAQLHPAQTVLNVLFFGGILTLNYIYRFMSEFSLVVILLTVTQLIERINLRQITKETISRTEAV